jgi:flagellar basal body P-ring formation protein FlgA
MIMRALPFALLLAASAAAAPFQNLDALEARVINALGAGVGEPGGPAAPIDRRLKLAACPGTVQIDPPAMGAIALRCPAANWRIRVPLMRLAGSGVAASPVPTMARAEPVIRRGDPVDLVAGSAGFSVSVSGVAQEDGAPGHRIRIRTDGAKAPVFAEVVDAGLARLPGFK